LEQTFLVRVRLPHSPASHSVLPGCEQPTRWSIQLPDVRQLTKKPAGLSALHRWNALWAFEESPSKHSEIIASTHSVGRQTRGGSRGGRTRRYTRRPAGGERAGARPPAGRRGRRP